MTTRRAKPKSAAAEPRPGTAPASRKPRSVEAKATREPQSRTISEGTIVDRRYRVRRIVAASGTSKVLEAQHVHTGAVVALKLGHASPRRPRAPLEEAAILGAVRHPSVVAVHDAGVCDTFGAYLALDLLEGRSVETLLTTRAVLSPNDAVAVVLDLCAALAHVHASGFVHRDVKPSNLVITRDAFGREHATLIDFDVAARAVDVAEKAAEPRRTGTRDYMAPEQLEGGPLDARGDVYAAGALTYELLTGALPTFRADGTLVPPSTHRAELGKRFDDVLARALARAQSTRTPSARVFADALEAALGAPIRPLTVLASLAAYPDARGPSTEDVPLGELTDVSAIPPPLPAEVRARRKHARAPYATPVYVSWAGAETDGRSEDVSEGGMLVTVASAPPVGTQVSLRFELPSGRGQAVANGRVKWRKAGRRRDAIGIEFLSIGDEARRAIADYTALADGVVETAADAEQEGNP